ncbi:hypothetical protein BGZ50_006158 [Haplosporangium sp. Z 11]|nr:hypothetical protein BGZ50_006158 [Haplosporangium sp. Z 11]
MPYAPLIKHALISSLDIAGEGQLEHISIAFECYKRERYDIARDAVEASANLSRLLIQQQGPSFDQHQPQAPDQFHIDFAFDFFPGWLQRYAERRPFGQDEIENENEDEDEDEFYIMDKVIIVGGGLGGLLLAILLERASLDYVVLERLTVAKHPLEGGGVIAITSQIQPVLKQLGLLDKLKEVSKPISRVAVHEVEQGTERQMALCGVIDSTFSKDSYQGIIIGADGAYSTVRLSLYRQLKGAGLLDAQDYKPMQYERQALVGMTQPLESEQFTLIKNEYSDIRVLVSQGRKPFTVWCVPMTLNRMCWILDQPLAERYDCPEVEDFSGNQQKVDEMCAMYRAMQSPLQGVLLGDLFDMTPAGTMLALPREERVFVTWTHGKIALMGDGIDYIYQYCKGVRKKW